MRETTLNPSIADQAPTDPVLTTYDEEHALVYIGLLDAEADGADWMEASVTVLGIDPIREPARAQQAWQSHLVRARWMTGKGNRNFFAQTREMELLAADGRHAFEHGEKIMQASRRLFSDGVPETRT